jgi:hypothetical protein
MNYEDCTRRDKLEKKNIILHRKCSAYIQNQLISKIRHSEYWKGRMRLGAEHYLRERLGWTCTLKEVPDSMYSLGLVTQFAFWAF